KKKYSCSWTKVTSYEKMDTDFVSSTRSNPLWEIWMFHYCFRLNQPICRPIPPPS
ncbi:hypothetical protein Y032_0281g1235, partial [Ancylostoma ceylanicum]